MGYACPVCGVEQADGVHLANHLAVTASLGREDHEAWLADYAPDWAECSPPELADRVVEHALEVDTPEFEDDGGARPPDLESALAAQGRQPGRGAASADVDAVLEEARELTERMYRGGVDGEGVGGDEDAGDTGEPVREDAAGEERSDGDGEERSDADGEGRAGADGEGRAGADGEGRTGTDGEGRTDSDESDDAASGEENR